MRSTDQPGERRASDPILRSLNGLQRTLDHRHTESVNQMTVLNEKVDRVLAGFPDGDPDGHRRFHEALIRKAEAREKFWNDMRAKLIERGVWATLLALGGAVLFATKEYLHK
ncbi:hypothetical protein [Herminiimonas contaminans]|uniref:Uncharacterized protein n=1 Tax=Herminiimonas contaminans TaxID=1111140 RepID=A0ABS0ETT0_9BURK|nr:hypothetical protein [Herminiimonas contaminans]MBF8177257.1 hypothetical protein [Herminiimonas contaminans]